MSQESSPSIFPELSGLGVLAQELIQSADRLVAFIDITDEEREREVKMYIHQRERVMCWFDRHPEEHSEKDENTDAIDEEA